ncbi:hypothetical protein CS022_18135 [Veronia nyctiphanis]|uniref:Uncharacterized protein n=1 Tax=Veronia nyctiphanis TaxID=1278244 RepID=A0A4Q0YSH7_9GAMM|nr:hypothetical protein [Veronia nyctiphanis]RXJ72034.1 hypothetical protein CS022_18040 [Veronia nyctiphanis]RXJ72049.1 hypothetical protein CS022_18135 [Veronia nyctiphanis]
MKFTKTLNVLALASVCVASHATASSEEVFDVSTCEDFVSMLDGARYKKDTYRLTNDIDCYGMQPLGNKRGAYNFNIEGNGYKVSHLALQGPLFNRRFTGKLYDLVLEQPLYDFPSGAAKKYLVAEKLSNASINNLTLIGPSVNKPFLSVFNSVYSSGIDGLTISGGHSEFNGQALLSRSVNDSVFSDVFIDSFNHKVEYDSTLLVLNSEGSKFSNVSLKGIDISWHSPRTGYSFLFKRASNTNVNGISFGSVSYPGNDQFRNHVYLISNDVIRGDSFFSNISHGFWGDGSSPEFPLYKSSLKDYMEGRVSNVNLMEGLSLLPPQVCEPYVRRDVYYSLPSRVASK